MSNSADSVLFGYGLVYFKCTLFLLMSSKLSDTQMVLLVNLIVIVFLVLLSSFYSFKILRLHRKVAVGGTQRRIKLLVDTRCVMDYSSG